MDQLAQIVGALLILSAYMLAQFGLLNQHSLLYLLFNLAGAATLTVLAYLERQWGFFLLEGVWSVVTVRSLVLWSRGADPGRRPPAEEIPSR